MEALFATLVIMVATVSGTSPDEVREEIAERVCPDERRIMGEDGVCRRKVAVLEVAKGIRSHPNVARGLVGERKRFETEDWLLLVPRAVLFFPKLVLMGAYLPIRAGVTFLDKHNVIEHTVDLLYNDARTAGILPYASFTSDFGIGVGANAFHKDLFGHDERISASARFGGRWVQGYQLRFRADRLGGSRVWLDTLGRWESNPSLLFAGIGSPSRSLDPLTALPSPDNSYYAQQRTLGVLGSGVTIGRPGLLFQPGGRVVYNHREFSPEPNRSSLTPIDEVYDVDAIPGFADSVDTLEVDAVVRLDLRNHAGLQRSGFFTESFVGFTPGFDPYQYVHWGSELSWDIELWSETRILTLRTVFEGVAGEEDEIPFSELPRLGGPDRLRGYDEDRFRDRSVGVTTIEYSYPIHRNVSGHFFFDTGAVAPAPDDLFDPSTWKFGYGGGLHLGSQDSVVLRLEVAGGDGVHFYLATDLARAFNNRSRQL